MLSLSLVLSLSLSFLSLALCLPSLLLCQQYILSVPVDIIVCVNYIGIVMHLIAVYAGIWCKCHCRRAHCLSVMDIVCYKVVETTINKIAVSCCFIVVWLSNCNLDCLL